MTFQPPSKSLTSRDYQFIALVVILFLVISGALIYANLKLTSGGGEFYVHWFGTRDFVFEKIEPYSADVPARTQQLVYGRPARIGEEPYILDTPFQILLLYFPFSLLTDPQLARAIFTWLLELALLTLAFFSLRLTEWENPRFFFLFFVLIAVFNFYTVQAILEASPVLILGLIYIGIIYAMRDGLDELAGGLIAISCYYWEVGGLLFAFILLYAYSQKRMGVFGGFFMVAVILFAVSFFAYPDWIIPFWRATFNNIRTEFGYNTFSALNLFWPSQGRLLSQIFILILLIALGYEWSAARFGDFRRLYWVSCLSLAVVPLIGFRTEMENLSVLVIPLALVFAMIHNRWQKFGNGLTALSMLVVFASPWVIYLLVEQRFGKTADNLLFLFLPLLTVIGLYWIRWWVLRPPRVWQDYAKNL
ncbi:MAG: hypothetical protein U0Z26_08620 [Anaerolineales bacterium]